MDVKIGRLTYVPDEASREKISSNVAKYPLSRSIGWQISGMRVSFKLGDPKVGWTFNSLLYR
jgi:hypothetical protein